MTASRKDSLVLEKSLPNGNCPFNALVLGWCRPDVLDHMDRVAPPRHYPPHMFTDFIKQSAKALGVAAISWMAVKNRLLFFRLTDHTHLQRKMAPVFRNLSIKLARNNRVFRARTETHLKSAFLDFVAPIRRSVDDDIFSRHQFIKDKFLELNPARKSWFNGWNNSSEKLNEQTLADAFKKLMDWWFSPGPDSGYEKFLQAMEKDGEWAGDMEISLVGDFLDVNIDVQRKDFLHHIHINHGEIEKHLFQKYQVIELLNRGIVYQVDPNDAVLRFLPLTEQQVNERLQALPDSEAIRAFVFEAGENLRNQPVPAEWKLSIPQLIQRNMIKRVNNQFYFDCDSEHAANLLEAFPEKEKMLQLWHQFYTTKPTITLVHEAQHWDTLGDKTVHSKVYDSFKFQIATALAANILYIAMLKKLNLQRFTLFANPVPILLESEETLISAKIKTPEL